MKKIVILVGLLLVTGCNANYNININKDLSIEEQVNISGTDSLYKIYYKTTKVNVLKELLGRFENSLKEKNYQYELRESDYPFVTIEKKYNSITEYINTADLYQNYFEKINYSQDGNVVKIETEGFIPNEDDDPSRFYVENLDVSIKCAYHVLNSNATKIDKKTNTYHFIMDGGAKDFKILLEFDTSRRFVSGTGMDIILLIISLFIIVILFWLYLYYKKRKKA